RALIPWYRHLVYPVLRRAAVTVVHSGFAADLLRHFGSRQRRVEVIPHPAATFASLDRQHARRSLGWEGDAPLLVLPGVLKGSKLVAQALAAAAPLVEQRRLRFALVGSVVDDSIPGLARSCGVDLIAAPSRKAYEQAIAAADCVLVLRESSIGETNGPLLDALGAGRAVLATPIGSIPEVAGDAALYCGPTMADIRASLTILCDPDELAGRAEAARPRAELFRRRLFAPAHQKLFRGGPHGP